MNTIEYKIKLINRVWYEKPDVISYNQEEDLGVKFYYHDKNKDLNVLISEDEDYFYICFRGTENTSNAIDNLIAFPRIKIGAFDYKCHRKWAESFLILNTKIEPFLDRNNRITKKPLVLIGHSMGSALAGIAALYYKEIFKIQELFLLANPGFTDKRGAEALEKEVIDINSYINGDDYIQNLVPFMSRPKFERIGKKTLISFSFNQHLPYSTKNTIGYVDALKEYTKMDFQNPWE